MDTEKIFSKLNSKDYNNQLEKILENKDFSEDVKNLLLSCVYKIDAGYKDYEIVKVAVQNKKTYIEEILEIIDKKCKKIVIVKEGSTQSKEMEEMGTKFLVDKIEGTIQLMYPNEILLLYTIYKLDDKQIYVDEKYNLIRNAFSELINSGENINNIEVLRDFNGWNWNTEIKDIPEISTNTVYQNLIFLLGIEFLKELVHKEEMVDCIELIKTRLTNLYKKENAEDVLNEIYKISIIISTSKNKREKKRLLEEKEDLEKDLERLKNKKALLDEISTSKKEALKRIKEIDTIISNKKLLEEEYVKRNEKRPDYNKIISLKHLTEILNKERRKVIMAMEENNKLLDPKNYVKVTDELAKQLELLKDIELTEKEKKERKREYLLNLQKIFIQCFYIKIKNSKEKEEIIKLLYMLRYYNYMYVAEEEQIKDVEELKSEIKKLENVLIKKAYDLKVINHISNEETTNNEIIRNVLLTKIISMENINLALEENNETLEIKLYDGDIYEKSIVIPVFNKKAITVKFNKTIKLFI